MYRPEWYEVIGFMSTFWLFVTTMTLAGMVALPYVVLRWRESRYLRRDPKLGLKVALHAMMSTGILLAITGVNIVAIDQATRIGSTTFTEPTRVGLALLLSGLILVAGHGVGLWLYANDREWPAVRRTYTGIRFINHALVVGVSLTGLLICVVSDSFAAPTSEFGCTLVVWTAAWLIDGMLLASLSRRRDSPPVGTTCDYCGYDLRGSVKAGGGFCPECGAPIEETHRRAIHGWMTAQDARDAAAATPVQTIEPLP